MHDHTKITLHISSQMNESHRTQSHYNADNTGFRSYVGLIYNSPY